MSSNPAQGIKRFSSNEMPFRSFSSLVPSLTSLKIHLIKAWTVKPFVILPRTEEICAAVYACLSVSCKKKENKVVFFLILETLNLLH